MILFISRVVSVKIYYIHAIILVLYVYIIRYEYRTYDDFFFTATVSNYIFFPSSLGCWGRREEVVIIKEALVVQHYYTINAPLLVISSGIIIEEKQKKTNLYNNTTTKRQL